MTHCRQNDQLAKIWPRVWRIVENPSTVRHSIWNPLLDGLSILLLKRRNISNTTSCKTVQGKKLVCRHYFWKIDSPSFNLEPPSWRTVDFIAKLPKLIENNSWRIGLIKFVSCRHCVTGGSNSGASTMRKIDNTTPYGIESRPSYALREITNNLARHL